MRFETGDADAEPLSSSHFSIFLISQGLLVSEHQQHRTGSTVVFYHGSEGMQEARLSLQSMEAIQLTLHLSKACARSRVTRLTSSLRADFMRLLVASSSRKRPATSRRSCATAVCSSSRSPRTHSNSLSKLRTFSCHSVGSFRRPCMPGLQLS